MWRFLFALMSSVLFFAASLMAQEKDIAKGRVGLTFPTTGIIWHLSDNIALLPNVGFTYNWAGYDSNSSTSTGKGLSAGVSLRFYTREWNGVRFYLSPKYAFNRSTSNSEIVVPTASQRSSSSLNSHAIAGAWGLQYPISGRVSIFGDIGVSFSRSGNSSSSSIYSESHSNRIGTTGSWGLILYLK